MTPPTPGQVLAARTTIAANAQQLDDTTRQHLTEAAHVDTDEMTIRTGNVWASLYRHIAHHPDGTDTTLWEVVDRYQVAEEDETILTPGGVGQIIRIYTTSTRAAGAWARVASGRKGKSEMVKDMLPGVLADTVKTIARYGYDTAAPDNILDGDDPLDRDGFDPLTELDASLVIEQAAGEVSKMRLRMYAVAMWRSGRHNVRQIAEKTGLDRARTVYPTLREAGIDPARDRGQA